VQARRDRNLLGIGHRGAGDQATVGSRMKAVGLMQFQPGNLAGASGVAMVALEVMQVLHHCVVNKGGPAEIKDYILPCSILSRLVLITK
jgi:hypothetical protein